MQWQHQGHDDNVHTKENWIGSIHNPLSCHRAKQKKQTTKTQNQTKHTKTPKKHTKNKHGRWSADQFAGIWNVPEEMITLYHLRDWYGKGKQERTNNTAKMPYSNLWARKQQRHNAETKAPASQEPRDHRVQAARATFSQILGHTNPTSLSRFISISLSWMTWSNRHLGFEVQGCALAKDAFFHQHLNALRTKFYVPDVATTLPSSWYWSRPSRRCAKPNGKSLLYTAGFPKWSAESHPGWIPTTFPTTPTPSSFLSSHTTPPLAAQSWAFLFPRQHLDAATLEHQDSPWHGCHIPRRVAETNNASRSHAWRSFRRRHDLHAVKARQQPT